MLIKDSTRFHIHESLKGYFPGCGGDGSEAGVSIQFEYDLKQGNVTDLDLAAGLYRDSTDAHRKRKSIQPKDLIIRDLGYYHNDVIRYIAVNRAYYISRLYANCNVYRQLRGSEKMDFGQLYYQMTQNGERTRDVNVYLTKERIPSRLTIVLMPEKVYEKRILERKRKNKYRPKSKSRSKDPVKRAEHNARIEGQKSYAISDEFKDRAHFNLFISNISIEDLSADEIARFYRVRWQIELGFKIWKSLIHIHEIGKVKYERLVCFIYMSLLWIVIHWKILLPYQHFLYQQQGRLISIFKAMDTLKDHCRKIRNLLRASKIVAGKELRRLYTFLADYQWLEKKKNKESFSDLYPLLFCKSNIYD